MTRQRVRGWVEEYGEDGVYVSFSGGKDSTVLLDIVRKDYPDIPAIFVDTGLEYPEIREFVKTYDDVTWLKPKMNFKQVIEKYGYPFISKEVSQTVYDAKRYLTKLIEKENALTDRQTDRQTDDRIVVDFTIDNPKRNRVANCIKARYDSGISNRRSEGSCVCERIPRNED